MSGQIYGTAFLYTSDFKLKENIKDIENALETVFKMRGVSYDLIEDGKSYIGFIAQEVEEVIPELVEYNPETDHKNVNYAQYVAILSEAVKEIDNKYSAEIAELKAEIALLKGE